MRLSLRQGIVRYEVSQSPPILSWSDTPNAVDLNVVDSPVVVTFAHLTENYVVEETQSIEPAWTGIPAGQTSYLYWDLDQATGAVSYGWTTVQWVYTAVEPVSPVHDLHWFDLASNKMRVYYKPTPTSTGVWRDKVRVFAGWVQNGANVFTYGPGSQVGLVSGPYNGGHVILGYNNVPLRQQNGTMVNTGTTLTIQHTTGQNVQFDAVLTFANASGSIPAYRMVSVLPNRKVTLALATSDNLVVSGIVTQDLADGELGQVITGGVVRNDQWNWSESVGTPVFCGPTGQVTTTPPTVGTVQRIGWIYDTDAVFIQPFAPVRLR